MKKFLILILILYLFFYANAEVTLLPEEIEEEESLDEYTEEEILFDETEIISSDTIMTSEIAATHFKYITIDYICHLNYIVFYAVPIGFDNIDYSLQWEYSLDGIKFDTIPYETDNTFVLEINEKTINWFVRATAIFDAY